MLSALLEFESGLNRLGKEFVPRRIVWLINFDARGEFVQLNNALGEEGKGKEYRNCPFAGTAGQGKATSFLFEKWEVLLALNKKGEVASNRFEKQRYFLRLLRQASDSHPDIRLIADALSSVDGSGDVQPRLEVLERIKDAFIAQARAGKKKTNADLPVGETVSFAVDLRAILDQTEWHPWWLARRKEVPAASKKAGANAAQRRCIATGELASPAERHEAKIKGLMKYGGMAETSLAAFDKTAFQSYGLPFAANAAMSADTAGRYVAALNILIKNNSVDLGDAVAVYWFASALPNAEDDPIALAQAESGAEPNGFDGGHAARRLLESINKGERPDLLRNSYHTLLLSGYSARVMVRGYTTGRLPELVLSVSRWFKHLEIVSLSGDGRLARTYGLRSLLHSLLPEMKPGQRFENWIKPISGLSPYLWNCALQQSKLPGRLLVFLVQRMHQQWLDLADAENPANRNSNDSALLYSLVFRRMGLLKAFQNRNREDTHMKPHLNPEHPSVAYHCGRLLAALADLQRLALGDVGAGVVQRFYGAFSQTPAMYLGHLVRLSQKHMNKIESYSKEQEVTDLIAEIHGRIGDAAPRTLTLEEQSLFALGYYQQIASLRAERVSKGKKSDRLDAPALGVVAQSDLDLNP